MLFRSNRLVAMTTLADAVSVGVANQKLSFRYDHLGRRIQKRVQNLTAGTDICRRYLYEGWNLVAEFDATESACGALVRSYSWGLDLTGSFTASGGVGALLQIADNVAGTVGLAARDGNGNVVALINPDSSSAPVAAAYEYSPFGEILRAGGSMAKANPFRFSSKFTDDESGLIYYGHRYFSPELGRFINRDPSEEQGGANLYSFCGNNGVSAWDRLGLDGPSQSSQSEVVVLGNPRHEDAGVAGEAHGHGGDGAANAAGDVHQVGFHLGVVGFLHTPMGHHPAGHDHANAAQGQGKHPPAAAQGRETQPEGLETRSEEHTSELQSH